MHVFAPLCLMKWDSSYILSNWALVPPWGLRLQYMWPGMLANMKDDQLLLKLDFTNAFNSVRRDKILHSVSEKPPALLPLAYSAYHFPSLLFFGKQTIPSTKGVQQGDRLAPCLSAWPYTASIIVRIESELTFFILLMIKNVSLEDVKSDLSYLEQASSSINLFLNPKKMKIHLCGWVHQNQYALLAACYPSLRPTEPTHATLLG